ncbi:MAG TPA: hypothetical protein VFO05_00995 [Candidatus Limnocylindrales bacterium]|nr:hypothetical protein [Candidatus Limnocylindrales bacterium]
MPRTPRLLVSSLPYLVLFGATLVVGAELARPLRSASIAPDSQAAVLYFDRILSGQRLEAFVPTNPKPLLSVIFGGLYALTGDWRTLAWVTLLAHATGVTLTALLATRLGGWIAGAVVGVLLMLNSNLLYDVGFALAVPFALLGWAVAGLAYSARTPRYAIAGLALAWATLARLETVALIGVIGLALAWGTFAPARWRIATAPRRAWLVPGLALLAFPVMLLHDQLLTGDPMYWASVAPRYAAQGTARLPSLGEVAGTMLERYWQLGGITLLAVIGTIAVVRARRWWVAVALLGLGPAVAALLLILAFRGVIVPPRYVAPIDVALVFAAGLGAATIGRFVLERVPPDGPSTGRWRAAAPVAIVVAASILLAGPAWLSREDLRDRISTNLRLGVQTDAAVGPIAEALAAAPAVEPGQPRVLIPAGINIRLALDLGLPLGDLRTTDPAEIDVAGGYPHRGSVVFHSRVAEAEDPAWGNLEIDAPRTVGDVELVPVASNPEAGYWVVAVR